MARADAPRERIGEMLVSLGLITKGQLGEALQAQRASKLPLGKQLVALGAVSETRLTQVLSNQLSVPWVSLERIDFPAELLGRIPAAIADACSVMPVYVRSLRGKGATLYVAMDDPTDEDSLRKVAEVTGLPVRPMIAPPSEIRRVIEQRYFGASTAAAGFPEESTGLRSLPDRGAKQFTPPGVREAAPQTTKAEPAKPEPVSKAKLAPPKPRKPPPPPGPGLTRADGVVSIEQYETPSQPPPPSGRTLTLLDGTQIQLPTAKGHREASDVRTVRHVIKAIRSAHADTGAEEQLKWHDLLQVVLDAVNARGARLTRAEISDAWLRHKAKREPKAQ